MLLRCLTFIIRNISHVCPELSQLVVMIPVLMTTLSWNHVVFPCFSWAWKALDDSRTRGMPQKCSFRWTENSSQSGSLHSDKKDVSRVGLWWLNFDEWFLNAGKWIWIIVFGIYEKIIITINSIYFIWYWVDMYTRKYTYSNLLC